MCSVRRVLAVAALGLFSAGCYNTTGHETMKLSQAPIIEDGAMALRNWEPVSSYYGNGTSIAQPVYYSYAPRPEASLPEAAVSGPALFVAQTVTLPVEMVITPPWKEIVYRGVYVPPTYTAVPAPMNDARWYPNSTPARPYDNAPLAK